MKSMLRVPSLMNSVRPILSVLALCLAPIAHAEEQVVGKVQALYVRLANGVMMEARLVRDTRKAELWADVQFAGNLANGRNFAIARVDNEGKVEIGDLVEVELAMDGRRSMTGTTRAGAPVHGTTRVTAIAAKNFTPLAARF